MSYDVLDNGVLRPATPDEIAEALERQANPTTALAESIPPLNLHLQLIADGHMNAVKTTFENMPGEEGEQARAYWDKAETVRRDNRWVNMMWPLLYPTEADFNIAWASAAARNP